MKALKIVVGLIVVVIAVVAVVVTMVLGNLNEIVKRSVEEVGPTITGTSVTLGQANITLSEGSGELSGLVVGNPTGYKSLSAFEMGKVALKIDTSSLTSGVVVIDQILIDGAQLTAEQKQGTLTNLQELADYIQSQTGGGVDRAPEPATESTGDVKMVVKQFLFRNSNINLLTQQLGDHSIPLPTIELKNIGQKEGGLAPKALANAMIEPVVQQATAAVKQQVASLAEEAVKAKAKEKLGEKEDELKSKLDDKLKEKGLSREGLKSLLGR